MEAVLQEHIQITPGVCGGKPRIAGHRIRVQDIVVWHEKLGMSPDEIASEHPTLTLGDVYAALAYYFDHRKEIEQDIQDDRAFVEAFRRHNPSLLQERLKELRGESDTLSSR